MSNIVDRYKNIIAVDTLPDKKPFLTTYIIVDDEAAIVDCGPRRSIPYLLEALKELHIDTKKVAYVLLTHIHIDHAGGVGELIKYLPEAKVVVHPKGAPHLVNPGVLWRKTREVLGRLAEYYGEILPVPKERIIEAREGDTIRIGEHRIVVWETPGHASHSITYELPEEKIIFPGDLAGVYIVPWDTCFPTTPTPFNAEKAFESLQRLINRKPHVICFPHYGLTNRGSEYLSKYIKKLGLWIEIVRNNTTKNSEEILSEILKADRELNERYHLITKHYIWRGSIVRSIIGIKSYLEWKRRNIDQR